MTEAARRTERAEHLLDEARAIAQQQVSAGPTHEPVTTAPPCTQDEVHAAVLAERERCARLVEAWPMDPASAQALAHRLRSGTA